MSLFTENLTRSLQSLEAAYDLLKKETEDTVLSEIYRNAVIKGFELSLETSGGLLRKALKFFIPGARTVDALTFKNVLRYAAKHALIEADSVERWFAYRDNRNETAHDYGVMFANKTLSLLPAFLADAWALEKTLTKTLGDGET